MKPGVGILALGLLSLATIFSLVRLGGHQKDVLELLGFGPEYEPAPIDLKEGRWFRPLPREDLPMARRLERVRENSDRFYDPGRRFEPAYEEKLSKHYAIERYLTSTRRNDPQYQRVMRMIASRGYGVAEWLRVCNIILNYKIRTPHRASLSQREKKESTMEKSFWYRIRQGSDFQEDQFAGVFGFVDQEFFKELLAVPLGNENREPILGFPGPDLEVGDRLYTDDDWLTPEIVAVQVQYDGRPRNEWSRKSRQQFGEFIRRSRMRALGVHMPEDRMVVQDLIGLGMIQPEALDGVEVADRRHGMKPLPPPSEL